MAQFQASSAHLRNGATNASTISGAVASHPVHQLAVNDLGHTGVAAALHGLKGAWLPEFQLRKKAANESRNLLHTAASDTEHLDQLLTTAVSRLGGGKR